MNSLSRRLQRFSSCYTTEPQPPSGFSLRKKTPCSTARMPHTNWKTALTALAGAALLIFSVALRAEDDKAAA